MSKFRVKIEDEKSQGKIFGYTLLVTRNGYQYTGVALDNASQMREVAKALISKADEIERKENNA